MHGEHIEVTLQGDRVLMSRAVFVLLLENSVVNARVPYLRALETSTITYSELVELARKAEVPSPLFFAHEALVTSQVRKKAEKLLQGVRPDTFTVNSRTTVELRSVELIIKDLLRKQVLLKKHDSTLVRNTVAGVLRKSQRSSVEQAKELVRVLSLDRDAIRSASTKTKALEVLVATLEAKQVLVSRSVRGYMPQLVEVHFSGLAVRDPKVPYIFLAGGDHGDYEEPVGRQIFTLVLMAVLVARGVFAPVTYDASSTEPTGGLEYDITGEILMPAADLRRLNLTDLDAVKRAADEFKVTPSAMTVRAMRLGQIPFQAASFHLEQLKVEFEDRPKPQPRQPKPVNAIRKYNGRELTARMLRAVDRHSLSESEFCRVVCLKHIKPSQIDDLRAVL